MKIELLELHCSSIVTDIRVWICNHFLPVNTFKSTSNYTFHEKQLKLKENGSNIV